MRVSLLFLAALRLCAQGCGSVPVWSSCDFAFDVPPGDEICWRRDRDPSQPIAGQWSDWDRAYVEPGATIDADL